MQVSLSSTRMPVAPQRPVQERTVPERPQVRFGGPDPHFPWWTYPIMAIGAVVDAARALWRKMTGKQQPPNPPQNPA